MAVTKVLARKGRLDVGIHYVLNGDKTNEQILTAYLNCDPGHACRQMLDTKRAMGKTDGVQYYHIIQSFKPGEVTPELALEIAREFAAEHLPGYQAVIGVHVDKEHIHAHTIFNSVNADTGEKYHSNARSYYSQIRAISDRLCREHGLSVIMEGKADKAVSYIEWLRQSRGQPTFRAMLEADLREAIEDANDIGHFFLIMEHKGYEIKHGNRLGFRLRGQDRFMVPGRKNPLFTEDGIRAAIGGNLDAIAAGTRPAIIYRPRYQPYRRHPKYTGFMALYVHYLYLLGKAGQRQYPPRMTPHLRREIMKFESYKEQFAFLRAHGITTAEDLSAVRARAEETLASLMKQRTILNVRKKKRRALYDALSDAEALAPARDCYESGMPGMEEPFARYMDAVSALEQCGIHREQLMAEKAELYRQLADVRSGGRGRRFPCAIPLSGTGLRWNTTSMWPRPRQRRWNEMNIGGGEAADQLVRMMLSGGEVAVRLTGSAVKNLLAISLALAKSHKKISGKVRMGKMLQQTRDLRVFPMTQEEYREFRHKAREPKLLYAAIQNSRDPNDPKSMVDVVMPATEVERANLVFQKMMYQQPEAPQKEQPERERQPEKEPGTPKKDSRSGRASRDTSTSSPMHAGSAARTTSDERPSVEGRLQDYRAQLEEQRRRAPARQKTKTRTKTR